MVVLDRFSIFPTLLKFNVGNSTAQGQHNTKVEWFAPGNFPWVVNFFPLNLTVHLTYLLCMLDTHTHTGLPSSTVHGVFSYLGSQRLVVATWCLLFMLYFKVLSYPEIT